MGTDSLISQFAQYNLWGDYNANPTFQKGCSSNTRDFWTTDLTTCKSSYVKATAGSASNGDPNCLVYGDWTATQVNSRYSARPAGCGASGSTDFSSVSSAMTSYYGAFKSYSTANTDLIDQLEAQTNSLNNSFTSMSEKLLVLIKNIDGIINPLVDIFKNLVGDSGLFQVVNCGNSINK